jgi:hypothetical protein
MIAEAAFVVLTLVSAGYWLGVMESASRLDPIVASTMSELTEVRAEADRQREIAEAMREATRRRSSDTVPARRIG